MTDGDGGCQRVFARQPGLRNSTAPLSEGCRAQFQALIETSCEPSSPSRGIVQHRQGRSLRSWPETEKMCLQIEREMEALDAARPKG